MPNHCSNHFRFSGKPEIIQQLYQHIVDAELEQPTIDFNRIIAMPECLDIKHTNEGMKALELFKMNPQQLIINTDWFRHAHELVQVLGKYGYQWASLTAAQAIAVLEQESDLQQHYGYDLSLGKQYQANLQQYGHITWYEWRLHHWGTKWNAYNAEIELSEDGSCLSGYFETAWSPAEPLYRYLVKQYPNIEMEIEYMDEFAGFAGIYRSDGEGVLVDYPLSDAEIEALFE